jgi:Leucine-rich repeat (LRR) protein
MRSNYVLIVSIGNFGSSKYASSTYIININHKQFMKLHLILFLLMTCHLQANAQISDYLDNPYKVWGYSEENRIKDGAVYFGYANADTEKIFCSLKKGEALPGKIFDLKNVKVLDFSGSYEGCCATVGNVSDRLKELTRLEHIYFNNIGVQSIPEDLISLSTLKSITIITQEVLTSVANFGKVPSLEVIYLVANGKSEIAKTENFSTIFDVPNLKILVLNRGMATAQQLQNVRMLTQLEILDLSENSTLASLPDLSLNVGLQQLLLRNSGVQNLGPDVGKLTELRAVDLANNKLSTLPNEFGKLKKLRYLELSSNELKELPSSMEGLDDLEHLVLRGNNFTEIPECIYKLRNLKELDLMETQISYLDKRLLDTKITSLAISHRTPGGFSFDPKLLAQMKSLKNVQMSTLKADTEILKGKKELKKLRPDLSVN